MTWAALRERVARCPRVAVYLTAPGCAPCKAIRPFVRDLFAHGWELVEVETPSAPEIAGQLLVFAHPTLILFADGREAERFSRIFRRDEVAAARDRWS